MLPQAHFVVFSFREEPEEPPFLKEICDLTLTAGGEFFEAKQVGNHRWSKFWEATTIDLMFVVSWRYLIPARVYQRARLGTFVFHDSLLPEYRGFAPTVWAIINGEEHIGVTLFEISEEMDTGDIVDQERVTIGPDEAIGVAIERVTRTYLTLLERNLEGLMDGNAPRYPQDHSQATYTCRRLPEDNLIDWNSTSTSIYNLIRAVSYPYPGAYTFLSGQRIRVWSAQQVPHPGPYVGRIPGRVVDVRHGEGSVILTGDGQLLLTEVQTKDGEVICASKILNNLSQTLGR
jgi:methionyl-tRNA formyltransferase